MDRFDLLFERIIKDYSFDNANTKAIFVFGRMNPPTAGHEMLINHAQSIAEKENRELFVFVSRTTDANKNPLSHEDKIGLLEFVFPDVNIVADEMANTPFNAAYWLRDHGFDDVKIVAGSDRKPEYESRFGPYIDHKDPEKSFNFKKFEVEVVGGERDPDSEGTSGVSASKARQLADDGNLAGFAQILPADAPTDIVKSLYNKIRKVHGINE